uniref:Armadillo repeat-containing protein 8 n=1 Tax=Eutreptiella gymnastica TaxID=73025 RepID=A0A7S1IHJ5_9EUGL|mmetsp:Transcript_17967/g.31907  ORF Transcript_17967/g.31907 Transcript_17967/m.31907 type:complete len:474 (+) Transcript_17967:109-1530(+)
MATTYHVSDFLEDRHPYNAKTDFRAQAECDRAKLFDGHGQPSLEHNIKALVDESISTDEKIKTLKYIIGHLTSADTKVQAIKYGLVMSLKWMLDQNMGSAVDVLGCMAFRSLAIIPAGVFSIYRHQGLPCIINVLAGRLDQPADRTMLQAREAAANAIQQLTVGWHAKWLLLGDEIPEGMVGLGVEANGTAEIDTEQSREDRKLMGRKVVETLTHLITSYNADNAISLLILRSALQSISNLSSESVGLDLCLICGVLREVDELLQKFANNPTLWIGQGNEQAVEIINLGVTVVWNVCMDPIGKRKEESLSSLPFSLGKLLLVALNYPLHHLKLKAAIAGAISTIYIYEDAKNTCLAPLLKHHEEAKIYGVDETMSYDISSVCVKLMHEGNRMLSMIHAGKIRDIRSLDTEEIVKENVLALVKNTVQAIRLISELPASRPHLVKLIGGDRDLCLQLYKTTPIEKEMTQACGIKL